MSGVAVLSDVLQDALARVRERLDNETITGLLEDLRATELRLQADPLQVVLFADGSGYVMAPEWSPAAEAAQEETGAEQVFAFKDLEELRAWLREGKLPEGGEEEETLC